MKQSLQAKVREALGRDETREFVRFLLVGGGGAVAYFTLSLGYHALGLEEWAASILSYATVLVPVYLMQHRLAFRSNDPHGKTFPRYIGSQAVGMIVATATPALLQRSTALPAFAMFASVAVVVPITNYLLLRFWTFRSR